MTSFTSFKDRFVQDSQECNPYTPSQIYDYYIEDSIYKTGFHFLGRMHSYCMLLKSFKMSQQPHIFRMFSVLERYFTTLAPSCAIVIQVLPQSTEDKCHTCNLILPSSTSKQCCSIIMLIRFSTVVIIL